MRVDRLRPGFARSPELVGAVTARDIRVDGSRWPKGRRLSSTDLDALAADPVALGAGLTVLILEEGDLHEDEAALALAHAVGGPGLRVRGPAESRVDLLAAVDGVLHVDAPLLERLNRIDPLEVFTAFDGSIVVAGDLVASVKVAPHVVRADVVKSAADIARARGPAVRVAPFVPLRVAAVVRESIRELARERFEASVRAKVESLGSTMAGVTYVERDEGVEPALAGLVRGGAAVDLVLTAGGGTTDPLDPFFLAVERLGGRIVRHGVPSHPGSMVWLGRLRRAAILGLPTCGAYSKATAADLVLPRLLTGERPSPRLVSGLGHGGILTRDQRFRFPRYARDLEAPEG